MINEIMHVGITVSNLDQSLFFYKDILGLTFQGELVMEGEETDLLFGKKHCKVRIAYLNGSNHMMCPPIELIQFLNEAPMKDPEDFTKTRISEVCFRVDDIDLVYHHLIEQGVSCLSKPQFFDFSNNGFGKSKALYFRDPDGTVLELMQKIDD